MSEVDAAAPRSESPWLAILVLAALAVGPYLPALSAPFVLDDVPIIAQNRFVTEQRYGEIVTSGYWAGFDATSSERQRLYRPLTVLSYAWNYAAGGLETAGYRAVNIALHVAVTLILFVLLRARLVTLAAFFAAALFAVHPLHTEAVTYISGRADLLAALGFIGAWYLHERASWLSGRRRLLWQVAAGVVFALGLLGKEMAATLPVVLMATDFLHGWCADGKLREGFRRLRARASSYAVLFVVLGGMLALRLAVIGALAPEAEAIAFLDNPLRDLGFFERSDDGLALLGRQIGLLLWPYPLSIDYSYAQIPPDASSSLGWIVLAALAMLAAAFAIWRRWFWIAAGIVTWFLTVAPISNLPLIIGTILGERTLYLPSIGLPFAIAGLLDRACRSSGLALPGIVMGGLLIGAFGWRTLDRNADYESPYRLWRSATRSCPRAARAAYNFGIEAETRADRLRAEGEVAAANQVLRRAIAAFERAVEIYPDYLDARYALARQRLFAGEVAAARDAFREILASGGQATTLPDVLTGLADAYVALGEARAGMLELTRLTRGRGDLGIAAHLARGLLAAAARQDAVARQELEKALEGPEPSNRSERRQMARALGELALVLERAGELEEARERLERAAAVDVDLVGPFVYWVGFLLRHGELDAAGDALREGFRRFPDDPTLSVWRARWQMQRGELVEAERTLESVLARRPGDAGALATLADLAQRQLEQALNGERDADGIEALLDAARRGFERVSEKGFDRPGLQYSNAWTLARLGRWREAAGEYAAIAAKRGPREGQLHALAGERWLFLGERTKARAAFQRALQHEVGKAAGELGMARLALPQDPEAASEHLARSGLASDDPERLWLELRIAAAGGDRSSWEEALERFVEAAEEDPRVEIERGRLALAADPAEPLVALEAARTAIERSRPGEDAYWQAQELRKEAALVLNDEGERQEAEAALKRWAPELR